MKVGTRIRAIRGTQHFIEGALYSIEKIEEKWCRINSGHWYLLEEIPSYFEVEE